MDALGAPATVEESQRLGRAAVDVVLRMARECPDVVVDSTWFPRTLPAVQALGPCIELRCLAPLEVVRARYAARVRGERHLDRLRGETELWGEPVAPRGVGRLVEIDTSGPVDVIEVAQRVRAAISG